MGKFSFKWDKVAEDIKAEDTKKKGFQADTRLWKPTVDEKGNATAVIRFLPDLNGTPYVKYYTHNFNYMLDGVKKYWIRNCINTFGFDKECPICKKNQEYWNSSFESDKAIASQRKRKLVFISNILVIKNPANPDQEGKVFLYNYGEKIFAKIKDKWFPSDDIKALGEYDEYMPFDLYEGANFKLVQVKQGEFPNYDKSEFNKQTPVGKEAAIEAIMNQTYLLDEFIAPEKFPTNEEVISKLGVLLGLSTPKDKPTPKPTKNEVVEEELEDVSFEPLTKDSTEESDDPDEDFFKNLK